MTATARRSRATGARLAPAVRRRQILDAAIEYFSEAGFGVQTRELTRRIGVTQPLLYRYFPSKQALIEAVFEEVFLSRLDARWIERLRDRSLPLRDRLIRFYLQYAQTTYRPQWLRIYMYAGLAGEGFNRAYVALVRRRLLAPMCEELRAELLPPGSPAHARAPSAREIEFVWNLHGSMFYWAVRHHIFGVRPTVRYETRTADAVDLFLAGAEKHYAQIAGARG
ncbi:MAG: TetR/AcrR family transcriptional regulator [Burkholderiaceae bacterium]|nr:TetR/AcrR family transcriptional regulator [Burkholderiaceae bacterium]